MAQYIFAAHGVRNKPLDDRLKQLLLAAADAAGIDAVRVTSAGQPAAPGGPRTGSTRHDDGNAADLVLERRGRQLAFTIPADLPFFEKFIAAATALGATGVGAGVGYMGPRTMHVGFGDEAVWGAGGRQANAPAWLKRAVQEGRAARDSGTMPDRRGDADGDDGQHVVIARSGLKLRAGPGPEFPAMTVLPRGTRLTAVIDEQDRRWARVDLEGDGFFDGYVFASYLARA